MSLADRDTSSRVAKMHEAIAPFARLADKIHADAPDEAMVVLTTLDGGIIDTNNRVTVGDLRRAKAAYFA